MERVTFLVEENNRRIPCLLNPDTVVVCRTTGVRSRSSTTGPLTSARLKDDPVLYTGGGLTEVELELLFDVSLLTTSVRTVQSEPAEAVPAAELDVRDLTRPLFELAEGGEGKDGYMTPPLVRFIWGKSWNILGVISALAERFDVFSDSGSPQRSWMRLRMRRLPDATAPIGTTTTSDIPDHTLTVPPGAAIPAEDILTHEVLGTGSAAETAGNSGEFIGAITQRYYPGQPWLWRAIAEFSGLDDPLNLAPGLQLRVPPASALRRIA